MPTINIRRGSKRQFIKDHVKRWILEQDLRPGERILSQNEFARLFETTVVTVHRALGELAAEGILHRRNGAGTFVGPAPRSTRIKRACLILPGEQMDDPGHNPLYWSYNQTMFQAFMESVGYGWTFTSCALPVGISADSAARELSHYDAVFFHYTNEVDDLRREMATLRSFPVISMGAPLPDVPCLSIDHDKAEGVRLGVAHMIRLGYRRIAFIGSREFWGDMAFDGYRAALDDAGMAVHEGLTLRVGEAQSEGAEGIQRLLARDDPFDAVLVDSDLRALGAVECLRQEGLDVPGKVGVMGYDGLYHATHQPPYLTTVRIPYREMIKAALSEVEKAKGGPTRHQHLSFTGELVNGRTCVLQETSEL